MSSITEKWGLGSLGYMGTKKRLPLSGSRRILWRDGSEDAVRGLLNVLKALQEQFGISAVESDIILRCGTGFESDG